MRLDEDGLTTETQAEIREDLVARLEAQFGVNVKTKAASQLGQIINILTELDALTQQRGLAVYRSFDPNGATYRALDARLALTGSVRKGAKRSSVEGKLTFSDPHDDAPNGMLIKNTADASLWELTSGTIPGNGAEVVDATFTAVDTGPKEANAGTTWEVVTVVAGLISFTNPTDDADIGRLREACGTARKRRLTELYAQGQGPLATIQGAVSKVEGVVSVRVYHNPSTDPVDSDGIPWKAFNVVVETTPSTPTTATRDAIFEAIWGAMGAGGEAYGTDYTGTVVDSEGVDQPVAFDVVDSVDIVLEIDLVTSTAEATVTPNITDVVAAKVLEVALADHKVPGRDVLALDYQGVVYDMLEAGEVSGVDGVTVRMAIDPASPAAVTKLAISIREKADFDSSHITVAEV